MKRTIWYAVIKDNQMIDDMVTVTLSYAQQLADKYHAVVCEAKADGSKYYRSKVVYIGGDYEPGQSS